MTDRRRPARIKIGPGALTTEAAAKIGDLMTRVETLREQASLLRTLADSFDDAVIRSDLLRVAERCEELANRIAAAIPRKPPRPTNDLGQATSVRSTPTADPSTE